MWFSCSRWERQKLYILLGRACNILKFWALKKLDAHKNFLRLTIFKAWFSLLILFLSLALKLLNEKTSCPSLCWLPFLGTLLWMQDIQKWHLIAGCADSLARICHFQKRSLSQIFQHGRFVGRRVKAGYLWVEADNGHFITQTSLVLKLLFSRIRQMTSSHDFDSVNWNWL